MWVSLETVKHIIRAKVAPHYHHFLLRLIENDSDHARHVVQALPHSALTLVAQELRHVQLYRRQRFRALGNASGVRVARIVYTVVVDPLLAPESVRGE